MEQNVEFIDEQAGPTNVVDQGYDQLAETAFGGDISLDNFFSRPIKIGSAEWVTGQGINQTFDPWSLYFENKRVINRITNYKLLRCDLHVKFMINGTPFSYGRAVAAYNPLHLWDNYNLKGSTGTLGYVQQSQKPKIFINPTMSQGGELVLPFFWYKDALDIINQDWRSMGEIELFALNELKSANGNTESLEISIFAWATNVKLAMPTQFNPASIVPQMAVDEYQTGSGPISRPAAVISNLMMKIPWPPVISPYARATAIGIQAGGKLAALFGYSKPALLASDVFRPTTKASIATVNNPDDLIKLSVDCKQETTIDPRTAGLGGDDELTILAISTRESYIDTFTFPLTKPAESLLWSIVVDPGVYRSSAGKLMHTACSFAMQPFRYWRGTMKYRFQVVASQYHRGRLKIVYDPIGNDGNVGEAEYNTAYTTIIDITESSDFEIDVGWGQATKYRESIPAGSVETEFLGTIIPQFYDSAFYDYGNGTLSVYIVNELAVPDDTINSDIEVNVFVKTCDDFEVSMPTGEKISRLRTSNSANPNPSDSVIPYTGDPTLTTVRSETRSKVSSYLDVEPQADVAAPEARDNPVTDLPDSAPVITTIGNKQSLSDATNTIFFGEVIRSFRQMLKRYNRHENVLVDTFSVQPHTNYWLKIQRSAKPSMPGYLIPPDGNVPGAPTEPLLNGTYYYAMTTLLNYIPSAFAGWKGGTRVLVDGSGLPCCAQRSGLVATRYTNCTPLDSFQPDLFGLGNSTTTQSKAFTIRNIDDFNGHEGATIQSTGVNPTLSFEVPYYSPYRFTPSRQPIGFGVSGPFNTPCYKLGGKFKTDEHATKSPPSLDLWYAAAEDFTCFFYVGPPPFWIEPIPPAS